MDGALEVRDVSVGEIDRAITRVRPDDAVYVPGARFPKVVVPSLENGAGRRV